MRPLFKLNGQKLKGFSSYNKDRFFIYNLNGVFLPSQALDWFSNLKRFQIWTDSTALYDYKVQEGDTIIDIGAGMGEEVLIFSDRVGIKGKVYAIEANPQVAAILSKVVALNKFKNVEVHNLAINLTDSEVSLADEMDSYVAGTIVEDATNKKVFTVKGVRLENFLIQNNISKVDFLKSNIEGAERFVVDSINKDLLKKIKRVAIACHDFRYQVDGNEFYKTKQYVADFLTNNGFEIKSQHTGEGHVDDYIYGTNKYFQE